MREIKFRAWIEAGWDDHTDICISHEMCYDLAFEDYAPIDELLAGVEHLMQYTGLKDKNGKEIYEGDYLSVVPSEVSGAGIVASIDGQSTHTRAVVWREEEADFGWRLLNGDTNQSGLCLCKNNTEKLFVVIGNVHENPELLNENR